MITLYFYLDFFFGENESSLGVIWNFLKKKLEFNENLKKATSARVRHQAINFRTRNSKRNQSKIRWLTRRRLFTRISLAGAPRNLVDRRSRWVQLESPPLEARFSFDLAPNRLVIGRCAALMRRWRCDFITASVFRRYKGRGENRSDNCCFEAIFVIGIVCESGDSVSIFGVCLLQWRFVDGDEIAGVCCCLLVSRFRFSMCIHCLPEFFPLEARRVLPSCRRVRGSR